MQVAVVPNIIWPKVLSDPSDPSLKFFLLATVTLVTVCLFLLPVS